MDLEAKVGGVARSNGAIVRFNDGEKMMGGSVGRDEARGYVEKSL